MRKILKYLYSKTPTSLRLFYSRKWKARSKAMKRMFPEAEVDAVLAKTNVFFLLGSGRCGTQLISTMLNKVPDTLALHEPLRYSDVSTRPQARKDADFAQNYVETFRKYEIFKKIRESNCRNYGEVSSPLRCLGKALSDCMPHGHYFILVRDGRNSVPSAMNRQAPRQGKEHHEPVRPLAGDPYYDSWQDMSPFEKTCWWWLDAYRTLLEHLPEAPVVQFEKILQDYDYVKANILDTAGLNLTKTQWEESVTRKSENAARKYTVKKWDDFSQYERDIFDKICGDMRTRLGYVD